VIVVEGAQTDVFAPFGLERQMLADDIDDVRRLEDVFSVVWHAHTHKRLEIPPHEQKPNRSSAMNRAVDWWRVRRNREKPNGLSRNGTQEESIGVR